MTFIVFLQFILHQIRKKTPNLLLLMLFFPHPAHLKIRDLFGRCSKLSNLHLLQDVARIENEKHMFANSLQQLFPQYEYIESQINPFHIKLPRKKEKNNQPKHIFCELFKFRQLALSTSKQRFRYSLSSMDAKNMIEHPTIWCCFFFSIFMLPSYT